jgi:hypothetical protein
MAEAKWGDDLTGLLFSGRQIRSAAQAYARPVTIAPARERAFGDCGHIMIGMRSAMASVSRSEVIVNTAS